jgi:RNA recognition motif-containing protein
MKLYVGNLSRDVVEQDLMTAFSGFGKVSNVTIIKDRGNSVSKGFGFVEMPDPDEAKKAIEGLHMKEMKGRSLDVNEARPKPAHSHGGNRGGFSGGGRGGSRGSRGGRRSW